uniref:RHS repeat-associated core domain-containing protein n=1 Tax=Clostridium sp. UBA4548 TaxID=1946361 RepID=UPI0025BEA6F3
DIIGLIDKAGTQVVAYNYDSWGKMTPSKAEMDDASDTNKNGITGTLKDTVGVKNPYRYRGYRYDTETGLYYLQSRYYNPEWGRFINGDALGGVVGELLSHNIFAYCSNDPINMKDDSGFLHSQALDNFGGGGGGGAVITTGGALLECLKGLYYGTVGTIGAILGAVVPKNKTKTSSPGIAISGALDIPMEKRKSGSYYPATIDKSANNVMVNFNTPMNFSDAQLHVRGGNDIYTFAQHNAEKLALKTGGIKKWENHIDGPKSGPGVYFNHYHGVGINEPRVHIFFDLPKIK